MLVLIAKQQDLSADATINKLVDEVRSSAAAPPYHRHEMLLS